MPLQIRRIIDAATDTNLTGAAINLFGIIALRADDQCELVITLRDLKAALGSGLGTVSRSIIMLEEKGYIQRKARTKFAEPTTITILPSPPSSPTAG